MFTFSQRKMIKKTKNYDCIVITLSLLAFLGLSETRRFIAKMPSKNLPENDSFEADHQDAVPFEEIQQQLNHPHYRDKRTSNDHVEYSKTFLDDNHNFALIAYSGLVASEVSELHGGGAVHACMHYGWIKNVWAMHAKNMQHQFVSRQCSCRYNSASAKFLCNCESDIVYHASIKLSPINTEFYTS